jgi:hypothetical protein
MNCPEPDIPINSELHKYGNVKEAIHKLNLSFAHKKPEWEENEHVVNGTYASTKFRQADSRSLIAS